MVRLYEWVIIYLYSILDAAVVNAKVHFSRTVKAHTIYVIDHVSQVLNVVDVVIRTDGAPAA